MKKYVLALESLEISAARAFPGFIIRAIKWNGIEVSSIDLRVFFLHSVATLRAS